MYFGQLSYIPGPYVPNLAFPVDMCRVVVEAEIKKLTLPQRDYIKAEIWEDKCKTSWTDNSVPGEKVLQTMGISGNSNSCDSEWRA